MTLLIVFSFPNAYVLTSFLILVKEINMNHSNQTTKNRENRKKIYLICTFRNFSIIFFTLNTFNKQNGKLKIC